MAGRWLGSASGPPGRPIWAIWILPTHGTWRNGRLNHYFQILEIAAVSQYKKDKKRLARHHDLRVLEYDVPMNYILNFSKDRVREVVALGRRVGREWLEEAARQ